MAGATLITAALCKKSNRVARVLAYALLEWILIALLLANGLFSYLISRFAAFFGLAPPCALCSRLGVDSLFEPQHQGKGAGAGAEPLRRVLCDGHAAEVSRLGYCRSHRRLADAGDMCEDCASAAASGKALLSWMRRSELGERDLACGCCGVTLESGFFSPPFLLPTPAARDMDYGHKRDATIATLNGDVVFVSEEGPVFELFDEKPLQEDDSIVDMATPCSEIVGNVEQLVPLESVDSSVRMSAVSSQSHGEGKEAIDHGTVEQCDVELPDHKSMTSDTKSVDSSVATISTDLKSIELVSVDQLKSALTAAQKSLSTLYAELENERSAAAIAADETMAMINRLQEQKAAMQMEAIQYQRLMEEQSEYDQEELQRLNELVANREKEKQDLGRELELYRHKVHLFEAKERIKISRLKADDHNGSSSESSSAEDSDDHSQSFYEGDESAHGLNGSNGSIPTDAVLQETARHLGSLDCSLTDFEEERLSVLEQLKLLEERLFDLEDEDSDSVKMDKQFSEENHLIGASNGFSDDDDSNFKLHDKRKGVTYRGKKLLPLFDDTTIENGNDLTRQDPEVDHSTEVVLESANEQDKLGCLPDGRSWSNSAFQGPRIQAVSVNGCREHSH
ncbi:hypothetical protein ABZP36_018068 [Zizania latifolia]